VKAQKGGDKEEEKGKGEGKDGEEVFVSI